MTIVIRPNVYNDRIYYIECGVLCLRKDGTLASNPIDIYRSFREAMALVKQQFKHVKFIKQEVQLHGGLAKYYKVH